MVYEIDFLKSLILTIFIETIVLLVLSKTIYFGIKQKTAILILAGFTASFATLPYLWFILPLFLKTKLIYVFVAEFTAVFMETFILQGFLRISLIKALWVSISCNMASYGVGLLFQLL